MKRNSFLIIAIILWAFAALLLLGFILAVISTTSAGTIGAVTAFILIPGLIIEGVGGFLFYKAQKLPKTVRPEKPQKQSNTKQSFVPAPQVERPTQPKEPKPHKQERPPRQKIYKGLKVVGGLPVPEGSPCDVGFDRKRIVFNVAGSQYCLDIGKTRSIELSQDVNKQVYSKGSLGGGLVGGALFGLAGAVIGSAPKKRIETQILRGVILGYEDMQSVGLAYIVLSDVVPNAFTSYKLVKRIKPLVKASGNIYHL